MDNFENREVGKASRSSTLSLSFSRSRGVVGRGNYLSCSKKKEVQRDLGKKDGGMSAESTHQKWQPPIVSEHKSTLEV